MSGSPSCVSKTLSPGNPLDCPKINGEEKSLRTWIKEPQAVWTGTDQDATNGIVIDGDRITELVAAGSRPAEDVDRHFDASNLVLIPGLINWDQAPSPDNALCINGA